MKRMPFLPLKMESAKAISRHLLGIGEIMEKFMPSLNFHLEQSDMDFSPREWLGLGFFISVVYSFILFNAVFFILLFIRGIFVFAIGISIMITILLATTMFMYFSMYPRLIVRRKVREIESNIAYVLRHLLVQVQSGVTVFNSMNSIAKGKYGRLSDEFSKAVTEINTGRSEVDTLEKMAVNNPSLFFRRVIWQMVNAMKSGADIGKTLKEIVDNITSEQKTAIKKYGSELNPLSLFYMMLVVIFPTLGIVFLLVMFSFVGVSFSLETLLIGILSLLMVVQFMFVGLIKNKRPPGL